MAGGLTRRRVLQSAGAGVGAWAASSAGFGIIRDRAALAQTGPDVYVVTLDDCSPEYLGYYQSILPTAYQGPIHTPELDALFGASWTASSARATTAVCLASRAAFLTASDATATGIYGDEPIIPIGREAAFLAKVASGQLVSLPGFLTSTGLDTAARGKVDHTGQLFAIPGQIGEVGTANPLLILDPDYAPQGWPGSDGSYLPYAVLPAGVDHVDKLRTDEQIARINEPYTGQRVDFLGFAMPHVPRTVHQSWIDLYDLADIQLRTTPAEAAADRADIPAAHLEDLDPPYLGGVPRYDWMVANLTSDEFREHIRHTLATLSHTSFQIGRLKAALDTVGRPYVIVLTADHGYFLGEKGRYAKGTLYDKALLTPLAIYSSTPSVDYPAGDVTRPISLQGLARTVAQLAGIADAQLPPQWGGVRFDDTSGQCLEHTWGFDAADQSRALIFENPANSNVFKLIVHPGDDPELYDLTIDPGEVDNLHLPPTGAGASGPMAAGREQRRVAAEAELDRRARELRAAEWLARGGSPTDPSNV